MLQVHDHPMKITQTERGEIDDRWHNVISKFMSHVSLLIKIRSPLVNLQISNFKFEIGAEIL